MVMVVLYLLIKKNLKDKIVSLRAHGKSKDKYTIIDVGLNSRLDTLQAAILLEKMKIFDWELEKKNIIAKEYLRELEGYYELPYIPEGAKSSWAQFTLQTKKKEIK